MPPKKRSANGNGASGDAAAPPAKLNRTDSDYDSMDLTSEVRGIVKRMLAPSNDTFLLRPRPRMTGSRGT